MRGWVKARRRHHVSRAAQLAYGARVTMQQPAIQAALDNLVEVIRTALTAEFLEYFRDGTARRVRGKSAPKPAKTKAAGRAKAAKKKATKKAARAAS